MYLSTPRACWQPVLLQPVLLKYYFKSLNTTSITIIMKRLHGWTAVALSHPLVERWDGWCYGRGGRQQMAAPPQGASSHSSDSWRISFLRGPCRSGLNKWHSTVSSPPFFFEKQNHFVPDFVQESRVNGRHHGTGGDCWTTFCVIFF